MAGRIIRKLIIGSILMAIPPFLIGLLGNFGEASGYEGLNSILLALYYGAVLILGAGIYAIVYFAKKKGGKGVLIGALIFLVLIPLVFLGTCWLSVGGIALRSLFVK